MSLANHVYSKEKAREAVSAARGWPRKQVSTSCWIKITPIPQSQVTSYPLLPLPHFPSPHPLPHQKILVFHTEELGNRK